MNTKLYSNISLCEATKPCKEKHLFQKTCFGIQNAKNTFKVVSEYMAKSQKGVLYGSSSKRHLQVCAIYSKTTVFCGKLTLSWKRTVFIPCKNRHLPAHKDTFFVGRFVRNAFLVANTRIFNNYPTFFILCTCNLVHHIL